MIDFADDFPVVAVLNKSEHIGETCLSEFGVDAHDGYVGSDLA